MATVLITGMAGMLARLCAAQLLRDGYPVVGVDYRPKPKNFPQEIDYYEVSYHKTGIADVFRRYRPATVMHLGRVWGRKLSSNKRFDLNVVGSQKICELSLRFSTRRLVVLSTFHIYGAHPNNHVPIREDDPLRAVQTIPKLSDVIQIDTQAARLIYEHPELSTAVLRLSSVVGPNLQNTMSEYLREPALRTILGYNPMWQFLAESDAVRALVAAAHGDARGIYNVTGLGALPLAEALAFARAPVRGMPSPMISALRKLAPRAWENFPDYLDDFFRYPVVLSDERFRADFGVSPHVSIADAISATRRPNKSQSET